MSHFNVSYNLIFLLIKKKFCKSENFQFFFRTNFQNFKKMGWGEVKNQNFAPKFFLLIFYDKRHGIRLLHLELLTKVYFWDGLIFYYSMSKILPSNLILATTVYRVFFSSPSSKNTLTLSIFW